MPTDLTAIDLATLNAVQGVSVAAIRNQCCQWEQQSCDAAAEGRLSNALMLENWAFAADLLAGVVTSEFTTLFSKALDARMNWGTSTRSVGDQLLDALTLEVAAAQSEPIPALRS
jgi:hypothetical protein